MSLGIEYRIGELAEIAQVSKRTIDYYTKLGLLEAKRSESNYRYYSTEAIETLRFIEHCKKMRISLEEIKNLLRTNNPKNCIFEQIQVISNQIIELEAKLAQLVPVISDMNDGEKNALVDSLSHHTFPLFQTLKHFVK
ncbi:MerR family transcriptional regulator [Gottfriedia luciferensis]|uniref:MerR family transcriptional regulator n=1 Tax=Gottfriedia luciferensis TaxID=178774 RepID=UPI00115523E0|nr:MerR family transcriptional regulator [Gottfriedia luciferensis]